MKSIKIWNNRFECLFFWYFLGLQCLFFVLGFFTENFSKDSHEYLLAGQNFWSNGHFYIYSFQEPFDFRGFTKRPPLYPLIISFFDSWNGLDILRFIQNGLSFFSVFFFYKSISNWNKRFQIFSRKHVWVVLITILLSTSQFIYSNLFMTEIWLQVFLMLTLSLSLRKSHSWLSFFFLIFLLCGLVLLKPIALFLPFLFVLFVRPNMGYRSIFLFIIPLILVVKISIGNQKKYGVLEYSSIAKINKVYYNTQLFINDTTDKAWKILDRHPANKEDYAIWARQVNKFTSNLIEQNFFAYVWFHLKGFLPFFLDPGRYDFSTWLKLKNQTSLLKVLHTSGLKGTMETLFASFSWWLLLFFAVLFGNILKLFAWIYFLLSRSIELKNKILFLSIVLYFLVLTGPLGASRFALPLLPIFIFMPLYYLNDRKGTQNIG